MSIEALRSFLLWDEIIAHRGTCAKVHQFKLIRVGLACDDHVVVLGIVVAKPVLMQMLEAFEQLAASARAKRLAARTQANKPLRTHKRRSPT
jgi:hypothetical protein